MMNIAQILAQATQKLIKISHTPNLDAMLLLANTMHTNKAFLYARPQYAINPTQYKKFQTLLSRRLTGEPIAYILGKKEFWSMDLIVTQDTLIPRPETELLVELLLSHLSAQPVRQILDLGTGCGAIALALAKERPDWKILATDLSPKALAVAQNNAKLQQLDNIDFLHSNWLDSITDKFDAIIANPPYISTQDYLERQSELGFEPRTALESPGCGLQALSHIISQAISYLLPNGFLCLEYGYRQQATVEKLLRTYGYVQIKSYRDLANNPRASIAKKP